jgi:hypothetical protein
MLVTYEDWLKNSDKEYSRELYEDWVENVVRFGSEGSVEFVRDLEGLRVNGELYYNLGEIRRAMEDVWELEETDGGAI